LLKNLYPLLYFAGLKLTVHSNVTTVIPFVAIVVPFASSVVHSNVTTIVPFVAIVVPFSGSVVHSKETIVVPFAIVLVVVSFP
jgi:hypothetical protein